MEGNHDIDYALIEFINARPEGNMLRDIAIRTLADRRRKHKDVYIPGNTQRVFGSLNTPSKSLFNRGLCRRILPSIEYGKLKPCGHNYKNLCQTTSAKP